MRDVGRLTGISADDLDAIRRARSVAWVEFAKGHEEEADAVDVAFLLDLANDRRRRREFISGIEALRSGDGLPAVVATTAGELRTFRRHAVREWREKH